MIVLDASAVLAYLAGEPGADAVESALRDGARCSAANWSETMQKVLASGRDWSLAAALLVSHDLVVEPVTRADAEAAASLWRRREGLSLGDRLCLALGARLEATVMTADRAWSGKNVRFIR